MTLQTPHRTDRATTPEAAAEALAHLEAAWQYFTPEDGGVTATEAESVAYYEHLEAA
jgi:hypothetical protein